MRYIYNIKIDKKTEYVLVSRSPIKKRETFLEYLRSKGYKPHKISPEISLIKIKV